MTLPLVRKDPLRLIKYIAFLFVHEVVHGTAAQKRRFLDRFSHRIAHRFGLYALPEFAFRVRSLLLRPFRTTERRAAERKYPRWFWITSRLDSGDELRDWAYRRTDGPKIIVLGMGSVGDVLQITPVLRALHEKLPNAEICLLHRTPAAKAVLRGNPYVRSIGTAHFYHFDQIKRAVAAEGIADLAVEIRSVSYIVNYTLAPESLRHPDFSTAFPQSFFAQAAAAQERWRRHPPVFPRRDKYFSWPEEWKDYHYLDVLGTTGNLPINRETELDFFAIADDDPVLGTLPPAPFITVQHGVDQDVVNWALVTGQRPTKLLPSVTWAQIVKLLRAAHFSVVQLGTNDDEPIEGVSLDLRGRTSLGAAAAILRRAACHVGIEGGLVHLARAIGTASVVAFGPTSATFLGYPQNVNIVACACNSCWWTTRDWYIYCPRGLAEPECMNAHRAETIVAAACGLANRQGRNDAQRTGGVTSA